MKKITIRNHSTVLDGEVVRYVGGMMLDGKDREDFKNIHIKKTKDIDEEVVFKVWEN